MSLAEPLSEPDSHRNASTSAFPAEVDAWASAPLEVGIYLYWIPLGAGGNGFVRLNGRFYEGLRACREKRPTLALYHTALVVRLSEGSFIVENAWPSPNADIASRGVVLEGPVWNRRLARFRSFRYEIRCWRDGAILDADQAVGSPQRVSDGPQCAERLLDLVSSVPALHWGRDELNAGDMWNSNSVISWLLVRSGLPAETIEPPAGGRATGWMAGTVAARREIVSSTRRILRAVGPAISARLALPGRSWQGDNPRVNVFRLVFIRRTLRWQQ